jgi:hypothetical protein
MQGLTRQGQSKRNWMFPDSNAHRIHRIAQILLHPTFLFDWLKTQLERREYNGEDALYEVLDKIVTDLSIEMIAMVFIDWMNRFQRLIDGNSDYVS